MHRTVSRSALRALQKWCVSSPGSSLSLRLCSGTPNDKASRVAPLRSSRNSSSMLPKGNICGDLKEGTGTKNAPISRIAKRGEGTPGWRIPYWFPAFLHDVPFRSLSLLLEETDS